MSGPGVIRSVCRVCHGGCGVFVHVRDGKVVKVKGDPDSPMNRGWMCVKGVMSPHIANHPERLTRPLRRKGPRGGGSWEEVSWEEALSEISGKLEEIRSSTGPESIAVGQGTGRHHYMHVVRFANQLGTPNWFEPGLAQCFIPRITVSNLTYGNFVVADYYGEVPPKCILFWGHNPLVTGPDGEIAPSVERALERGATGITIDPRRSETAIRSKLWLPVRPATDAALALAMINFIIEKNLYDRDFVERWTSGFDELKEHVRPFTPKWASAITTVTEDLIMEAATLYATSKPAVLEWGLGLEQNPNSLQTVRSVAILRAITGNLDVPGGDILGMNILRAFPTLKDKLPEGMARKRLGGENFKLLGGWRAFMPSAHIPAVLRAMREGNPYRVRALLVFMTPTAALADYVLPAAFWTETEQVIGYPLVVENMAMAQVKAARRGEARQDEWIMDELARRMNLPGSGEGLEEIMAHQLTPLGITFDELKKRAFVHPPHRYRRYEEKGFRTPSRKVELYSRTLRRLGYSPLPTWKEPLEPTADFPLILITGARRPEFFHSEHRQTEPLRRRRPFPQAELHPSAAEKAGIRTGDWMRISTKNGAIRMKALVTGDIHPQVVSVEHGWWFPERKETPLKGVFESNANVLTSPGPPYDPAFGSYTLRGLACNIEKEKD